MKKVFAVILMATLLLMVGCNEEKNNETTTTVEMSVEETTDFVPEETQEETYVEDIQTETEVETVAETENEETEYTTKDYVGKDVSEDGEKITEAQAINVATERFGLQGGENNMYISSMVYIRSMPYYAVNVTLLEDTGLEEGTTHIFVSYDGNSAFQGYVEDDGTAVVLG